MDITVGDTIHQTSAFNWELSMRVERLNTFEMYHVKLTHFGWLFLDNFLKSCLSPKSSILIKIFGRRLIILNWQSTSINFSVNSASSLGGHVAPRGIGEGKGMLYLVARHPRSDVRCASPPSSSTLLSLSLSLSLAVAPHGRKASSRRTHSIAVPPRSGIGNGCLLARSLAPP